MRQKLVLNTVNQLIEALGILSEEHLHDFTCIYLHHFFDQIIAASHDPTPKGSYGEKSLYFKEIQVGEILNYNMAS